MPRFIAALAAAAFSAAAFSQAIVSPATQQVQQLAPQLVAFAGSAGNFESLVTGLTTGTPVTLTSVGADGALQVVTFVPGALLSPADVAVTLETARQNLIVRGVAAPTPEQLAVSLLGGALTTAGATAPFTGVLTGTSAPGAFQVRNEFASLANANLQPLRDALAQGTLAPGRGPMSAFEVNQALQLAANLLAQHGVANPSAEQLRLALLGGTLELGAATPRELQGILAGPARNTSDSASFGTSASRPLATSTSPFFGTSDTPARINPVVTPPASVPAAPVLRPGSR